MQRIPPKQPTPVKIQPKLQVNEPGDSFEQEADAMAEKVMRMKDCNQQQSAPNTVTGLIGRSVQRKCAHCEEEEKQKKVMRKEQGGVTGNTFSSSFASSLNNTGSGAPLQTGVKNKMEHAFQSDFSGVRIHTGPLASNLNKAIQAKAFTYGNDIYFNQGQYNVDSYEGNKLLAHELTHVVQQGYAGERVQRKSETDQQIEDMLLAGSFEAKWKIFTEAIDNIKAGMFSQTPAYFDISGAQANPMYNINKEKALDQVDELLAHLEQNEVDAFKYGMILSDDLAFLKQQEKADRAAELYQQGYAFMQFMKGPKDFSPTVEIDPEAKQPILPEPEETKKADNSVVKKPAPLKTNQTPTPAAPEQAEEVEEEEAPVEKKPAEERLVKDLKSERAPFAEELIVKFPGLVFLMADGSKPYLITGSLGRAITNGRVVFGNTNFVIMLDLKAFMNNIEKYYVVGLKTKGAVYDGAANYALRDFASLRGKEEETQKPVVRAQFTSMDKTLGMMTIAVMLQDNDISPKDSEAFIANRKITSAIKNEFVASPELAKPVFEDIDALIGKDKTQAASEKLAALTEAAFALVSTEKKIKYLEVLIDAFTWEAQEKAIVEIFKSVSSQDELVKIKDYLKSKKTWDGSTVWLKMFSDLNHETWSLLVAIGTRFGTSAYTLSEFKTLLGEIVRNMTVIGVFINSNGEPEIIPNAVAEIETGVRALVDFLESIWDSIEMIISHPDKLVEGVAQMVNMLLNLQLAQMGYPPAMEFIGKVFTQISKQVVAGFRGLAILGVEDAVIKKVKWALVWEVASWFVGIGEIKAALKGVQISGMTEKAMAVVKVISKITGIGKLTIKETELISRLERLATILVKESKLLQTEEEAMKLLSKMNNAELEKVVAALQKSDIAEGKTLLELAKETPELEGLAAKIEAMQKLASTDRKVAMTEKEITNLQKLVAEESDPLFSNLLKKEEQIFNEKAGKAGNVMEVTEKKLAEAYDVEVKVGDHTYRRKIEDGTWCRFSTKKCNIQLDNSGVNKQRPLKSGTEPVGVVPTSRGYAIEDDHLAKLAKDGWDGMPDYYPRIDGVKGGTAKTVSKSGKKVRQIEGAEVLSIKSTFITNPEALKIKIREFLDAIKPYSFSNGEVYVKNVKSKNLHLIFDQGFLAKVDNKEVIAALKEMTKTAKKEGVLFEWFVIPADGKIRNGPDFLKKMKNIDI